MIIKDVIRTEKAIHQITLKTVVFVVDDKATKSDILNEVQSLFNAKVKKIRTMFNFKGQKIAYVKFKDDVNVDEIASKLNIA